MNEAAMDTPCTTVSSNDLGKLRHMLGIESTVPVAKWGYRNHFAACPGSPDYDCMLRLVAAGLVWQGQASPKMVFFHANEAGCRLAGLNAIGMKRALGD